MTSFQNIFEGYLLHMLTARSLKLIRNSEWYHPEESPLAIGWWNGRIVMTAPSCKVNATQVRNADQAFLSVSLRDKDVLDFRHCTISRFYRVKEGEWASDSSRPNRQTSRIDATSKAKKRAAREKRSNKVRVPQEPQRKHTLICCSETSLG
jgi:hypothetical protein